MITMDLQGLDEVLAQLENLEKHELSGIAICEALEKSCAAIERSAKQKAPKDTGALRRSITSKVWRENSKCLGMVYTPLEYAPYIEYGTGLFAENGGRKDVPWCYQDDKGNWHTTSGQHPQPFMRPALNENRERVIKYIKYAIKQGVDYVSAEQRRSAKSRGENI